MKAAVFVALLASCAAFAADSGDKPAAAPESTKAEAPKADAPKEKEVSRASQKTAEKAAEKPAEKSVERPAPVAVTPSPAPAPVATASSVTTPPVTAQDGEKVDPREKLIAEQALQLCRSTDEYIKTLTFLRETKEIIIPERTARMIAMKVSRGCDGAANRFEETLRLLRSVGISDPKSLEVALQFSAFSNDTQKNFLEIFSKSFLAEFLDYDYAGAVSLALELSRDYHGDASNVREDFLALSRFCRDSKSMDLPTRTCSQYAVKMARLSEFFPNGVRGPFVTLYTKLREDRDFGLDVKSALDITYNVLKNGPAAPDNFMNGYAYAMKEKGLGMGRNQALEFALKMAVRSYSGEEPPAIPSVKTNAAAL